MKVPATFYVNEQLEPLMFEELKSRFVFVRGATDFSHAHSMGNKGEAGFLPAVKQLANVASLPGIVKARFRKLARATLDR